MLSLLRKSPLLGSLKDAALARLVTHGHTRKFNKGEILCWRGDPGDSAMLILSGGVKVTNMRADGREIGLNFICEGELVGEIALLDGGARTATVAAFDDSEVFVVRRKDVLEVLASDQEAVLELIRVLCERVRNATAIIEDSTHEMQARLARGLLRLARQHGTQQKGRIKINLKLSQTEIGNYAGLSRPNVSRQLSQLRTLGLIGMERGAVVILDEAALEQLADDGPNAGQHS